MLPQGPWDQWFGKGGVGRDLIFTVGLRLCDRIAP